MSPIILPLDIYHLIKFYLPSSDLLTHTNLYNTSLQLRKELYPTDKSWKPLLQASGFSLSNYDLHGARTDGRRSSWRTIVLEIVRHERRGCNAEVVVGVDPGSEGVLGETYWDGLCDCLRRRRVGVFQPSSSLPIPLTPAEVKKDNLQLTPNENLRLSYPWSDELLTLDLDGQVVIRARVLSSSSTNGNEPPPGFIRLKDHPAVASSFATSPPVTELRMWFGHTLVSNPEGVTVWDVRQAFLNSPVLSSSHYNEDGLLLRGIDTWFTEAWGVQLPPGHETDLLGRDGLEQEKKGSVRIGHYSLWVISAPPQPQEEEEE